MPTRVSTALAVLFSVSTQGPVGDIRVSIPGDPQPQRVPRQTKHALQKIWQLGWGTFSQLAQSTSVPNLHQCHDQAWDCVNMWSEDLWIYACLLSQTQIEPASIEPARCSESNQRCDPHKMCVRQRIENKRDAVGSYAWRVTSRPAPFDVVIRVQMKKDIVVFGIGRTKNRQQFCSCTLLSNCYC